MASVTYRPGPHDPATVEWGGTTFPANVAVEVSNTHILRKALGNPFFEVDGEVAHEAPPPDEKDALVTEAEALGIDVDKRWGVTRLKAEIDAAKAKAAG
jgi:hypothetical protein